MSWNRTAEAPRSLAWPPCHTALAHSRMAPWTYSFQDTEVQRYLARVTQLAGGSSREHHGHQCGKTVLGICDSASAMIYLPSVMVSCASMWGFGGPYSATQTQQLQLYQAEQATPPQSSEPMHRNQDVCLTPRRWILGKLPLDLDTPLGLHVSLSWTAGLNSYFPCMLALHVMTPSQDLVASWTTLCMCKPPSHPRPLELGLGQADQEHFPR